MDFYIFDNSIEGKKPQLVYERINNQETIYNQQLLDKILTTRYTVDDAKRAVETVRERMGRPDTGKITRPKSGAGYPTGISEERGMVGRKTGLDRAIEVTKPKEEPANIKALDELDVRKTDYERYLSANSN